MSKESWYYTNNSAILLDSGWMSDSRSLVVVVVVVHIPVPVQQMGWDGMGWDGRTATTCTLFERRAEHDFELDY